MRIKFMVLNSPSFPQKQNNNNKRIQVKQSGVHGKGVFALKPIAKGEKIIEYKGQLITWQEADARHPHNPDDPFHTFFFQLENGLVIDGGIQGNSARWINHSCNPNAQAQEENSRVFIYALKNIKPGEEITYDYLLVLDEELTEQTKANYACCCGSKKCRKTMLNTDHEN